MTQLLTRRHKDERQDASSCQEQNDGLRGVPAQIAYGDHSDELGWDIDPTKDELENIEVDAKFLHTHSQTIVGKTGGKPEGQRVSD